MLNLGENLEAADVGKGRTDVVTESCVLEKADIRSQKTRFYYV
jgi:hypothetical protein